jgi:hypothetical protein
MAKHRYIDPKIRRSESVAKLTYRQRDLWYGLILTADDQGRMKGRAELIRSDAWPLDDVPLADVQTDLDDMEKNDLIIQYEVDGNKYIQIKNWKKYQSGAEWLGASEYPAPEGWEDRYRYHGKGKTIVTSGNWYEDSVKSSTCSLPSFKVEDKSLHDVDDDVDDDPDDDGKDDVDVEPSSQQKSPDNDDLFYKFSEAFSRKTQIPRSGEVPEPNGLSRWDKACVDLAASGATVQDMYQAINELPEKYNVSGPWSVITPTLIAMSKRLRKNGRKPKVIVSEDDPDIQYLRDNPEGEYRWNSFMRLFGRGVPLDAYRSAITETELESIQAQGMACQ